MSIFSNFKPYDESDAGTFELIADNSKHQAIIAECDWIVTKNNGRALKLLTEITNGEHVGRKIFDYITLVCPGGEKGVEISLKHLRKLCVGINKEQLFDDIYNADNEVELEDIMTTAVPAALLNQAVEVTIGVAKGTDGYPDKNKVKTYGKAFSPQVAAPSARTTVQPPAWRR